MCGNALNLIQRSLLLRRVYSCFAPQNKRGPGLRSRPLSFLNVIDCKRMASFAHLRATRFKRAFPGTLVACCRFVEFNRDDRPRDDGLSFLHGSRRERERERER